MPLEAAPTIYIENTIIFLLRYYKKVNLTRDLKVKLVNKIFYSGKKGALHCEMISHLRKQFNNGLLISDSKIHLDADYVTDEYSDLFQSISIAWVSDEFINKHGFTTPYPEAPELCIQIMVELEDGVVPENTKKLFQKEVNKKFEEIKQYYFTKGAKEVWLITDQDKITYYNASGVIEQSDFDANTDII